MRKNQTPDQSYENFCKAFAGVFLKHAKNKGTYHTCYIRGAIDEYCRADSDTRHLIMEDATAEDACGYRIARALIVQGWDIDTILKWSLLQQDYIDELDYGCIDVMVAAGYTNVHGFSRHGNGCRYAWLLDGGQRLKEHEDDMENPDED